MNKKQDKKLFYQRKNFWKEATPSTINKAFAFAEPHGLLNQAKTVREAVAYTEALLKEHKFQSIGGKRLPAPVSDLQRQDHRHGGAWLRAA